MNWSKELLSPWFIGFIEWFTQIEKLTLKSSHPSIRLWSDPPCSPVSSSSDQWSQPLKVFAPTFLYPLLVIQIELIQSLEFFVYFLLCNYLSDLLIFHLPHLLPLLTHSFGLSMSCWSYWIWPLSCPCSLHKQCPHLHHRWCF